MVLKINNCLLIVFCLLGGAIACTKSFQVGDCIQEVSEFEEEQSVYKITQMMNSNIYGLKYNQSEQGNETIELDATVQYKKIECPDSKRPAK